jgi:2-phospho-L-lactate guanylyltransferase
MKTPAILIPFKGGGYKSRLSPILSSDERRRVAYLLLKGTLRVVRRAGMQARCYVVSSDSAATSAARAEGASFVDEVRSTGVNGAVRLAVIGLPRFERFMVIPSDLPLLQPSDLQRAEELGWSVPLVISPSSSFSGTNLLLFSRRRAPALSFDNNSFWNHLASAASKRLRTAVFTSRGVLLDLDTPADVEELFGLGINTRMVRFLRKSFGK